jgi:acetyltransferase-like isoleucine patch superfamily enzyme
MKAIVILLSMVGVICAGKIAYVPINLPVANVSFDSLKSSQSENFLIMWGDRILNTPSDASNGTLKFHPDSVLKIAEDNYNFYVNSLQFVKPYEGKKDTFKFVIIMDGTWKNQVNSVPVLGALKLDSVVWALRIHPTLLNDHYSISGQFIKILQNLSVEQCHPDSIYKSYPPDSNSLFFWSMHSSFMLMQKYPDQTLRTDPIRFTNLSNYHFGSYRNSSNNWYFLQYIAEKESLSIINKMWKNALLNEHPLSTYKRLMQISHDSLCSIMISGAMHNVLWDNKFKSEIRQSIATSNSASVNKIYRQSVILESINKLTGDYKVSTDLAPQDFGYNVIRLYPQFKDSIGTIHLKLKGHRLERDLISDWRFAFVSQSYEGKISYSKIFSEGEIVHNINIKESEVYLVVMSTPKQINRYAWGTGFPRITRYPYQIRLEGAYPEGYQSDFRNYALMYNGSKHKNGGGFIASTAIVDSTVFVGENAAIINNAKVLGNVRVEGSAVIKDDAFVSGSALIKDFAIVGGNAYIREHAVVDKFAQVFRGVNLSGLAKVSGNASGINFSASGNAEISDAAMLFNGIFGGSVLIGGDFEDANAFNISNGKYLQNINDRLTESWLPDGIVDHFLNVSVTPVYTDFTSDEMRFQTTAITVNAPTVRKNEKIVISKDRLLLYDLTNDSKLQIYNAQGRMIYQFSGKDLFHKNSSLSLLMANAGTGAYFIVLINKHNISSVKYMKLK